MRIIDIGYIVTAALLIVGSLIAIVINTAGFTDRFETGRGSLSRYNIYNRTR